MGDEREQLIRDIESDVWNAEAIADLILAHAEQIAAVRRRNRELTERLEELSGICQGYANEIEIGHKEYMKLHARLEAAEKALRHYTEEKWAPVADYSDNYWYQSGKAPWKHAERALAPAAPVKPVAGEERT